LKSVRRRTDVTNVPETAKPEKTSQELFRKRCHVNPMTRMTTLAMKMIVKRRKM
jgi:hypothetical protein